jgi:uncharacterized protein
MRASARGSLPARTPSFRIGRARTGLGLFATRPIAQGAFIVAYTGRRIPTPEARAREARGSRYMFELDARWTIDGSPRSNLARYANHACDPNAEASIAGRRVLLHAVRTIRAGEEITYDYGADYFELFLRSPGCRCRTCRAAARGD